MDQTLPISPARESIHMAKENLMLTPASCNSHIFGLGFLNLKSPIKSPTAKKRRTSRSVPLRELQAGLPVIENSVSMGDGDFNEDNEQEDGDQLLCTDSPERMFPLNFNHSSTPAGFIASPMRPRSNMIKLSHELKAIGEHDQAEMQLPSSQKSTSINPSIENHCQSTVKYVFRSHLDESPNATLLSQIPEERVLIQPAADEQREDDIDLDADDADVQWSKRFMSVVRRNNRRAEKQKQSRKRKSVCRSIAFEDSFIVKKEPHTL
eukprot:jgi/Bigna1/67273/fgenesh1_pg.3_\